MKYVLWTFSKLLIKNILLDWTDTKHFAIFSLLNKKMSEQKIDIKIWKIRANPLRPLVSWACKINTSSDFNIKNRILLQVKFFSVYLRDKVRVWSFVITGNWKALKLKNILFDRYKNVRFQILSRASRSLWMLAVVEGDLRTVNEEIN